MPLLSIDEALAMVLADVPPPASESVALSAVLDDLGAHPRTVSSDVVALADQPAFDKSLMDGWAIGPAGPSVAEATTSNEPRRAYHVIGEVVAGARAPDGPTTRPLGPGEAVRIMTGAVLPPGTIAVVPWEAVIPPGERNRALTASEIAVPASACAADRCLLRAGSLIRSGETLLEAGQSLTAIRTAVLVEQGIERVEVVRRPTVAILTTGDEVARGGPLAEGQIRDSNAAMLRRLAVSADCDVADVAVVPDDGAALRTRLAAALAADVVILTGGVSAGTRDLVPGVLADLGVLPTFHGVDIKPGKPLLYGRHRSASDPGRDRHVFGLPGNPLAVRVTWEVFVRPLIAALGDSAARAARSAPSVRWGQLANAFRQSDPRPTFWPARATGDGQITLVEWKGSSDLVGASRADAMAILPGGPATLAAGTEIRVWPLDD